jgi:hypothetical protein
MHPFRRWVSLPLFGLLVGCIPLIWFISTRELDQREAAGLIPIATNAGQTEANGVSASASVRSDVVYLLPWERSFDLGPMGGHAAYNQVTDATGTPLFPPPQVQITEKTLILPFFASTIELTGRWWRVEASRRHVGGYLKISRILIVN